jgi:UTP--glucose-1-phosphate uridylyltransferase
MIHHAVIPAAGFGTRMLPAAKAVPKELLPVLDRPVMQYVIEEVSAAGISDVTLVTAKGKQAIEDHFRPAPELENRLNKSGKLELLASVRQLMEKVRISPVFQPDQRGLGDAVMQARAAVRNNPFVCLLGDTIFSGGELPAVQLVRAYDEFNSSVIGLEEVAEEKVSRYGIVGGQEIREGVYRLDRAVEKPSLSEAPSRLAIAARYLLTPEIFDCLDECVPATNGEIQLTDALALLMRRQPVYGVVLNARRHDIGNPVDWLKTNLIFAQRDKKLWQQIEPLLRSLLAS